jgi:hypothetical protein
MADLFNEADSSVLSSAFYDKVVGGVMKSDLKLIGCERWQVVVYKVMNLKVAKDWGFSQICSWIQVFLNTKICLLVNIYRPFGGTNCLRPHGFTTYQYRGA